MAVMQPDSFAPWIPNTARQAADFTVRPATPGDIEACVRLVATIGAAAEARSAGA